MSSSLDKPPQQYVAWKPNRDFIKFFEDMKKGRVTASDRPTVKVTDTPIGVGKVKRKPKSIKVNYSSVSETLVNSAHAQTRRQNKPISKKKKAGGTIRRKTAKGEASLERKIRKHKF